MRDRKVAKYSRNVLPLPERDEQPSLGYVVILSRRRDAGRACASLIFLEKTKPLLVIPWCPRRKLHQNPFIYLSESRRSRDSQPRKTARVARVTSDVDHQSRAKDTFLGSRAPHLAPPSSSTVCMESLRCASLDAAVCTRCNPIGNCIVRIVEYRTRIPLETPEY